MGNSAVVPERLRTDAQRLWDYHDMGHELRRCDVGVGLGSHDLGVADHVVELHGTGWFPARRVHRSQRADDRRAVPEG